MRHWTKVTIGCAAIVLIGSGCSEKGRNYEIPSKICGISIVRSDLAHLLPDGNKIKSRYSRDTRVPEHRFCDVYVDGRIVFSTEGAWEKDGFTARQAAGRQLIHDPKMKGDGRYAVWSEGAATVIDCVNSKQHAARFSIEAEADNAESGIGDKIAKFLSGYAKGYKKVLPCEN